MERITGKVVRGDGYGKKLGFPTANLEIKDTLTKHGVYSGIAKVKDKSYKAGILINPNGKVEAHLLNFDGDLYGKMIKLQVGKFLREYKRFNTEEELITQIKKDLEQCKKD